MLIPCVLGAPGGLSPITKDFVNPEKPWPHAAALASLTVAVTGLPLLPRLPVYPSYISFLPHLGPVPFKTCVSSDSHIADASSPDIIEDEHPHLAALITPLTWLHTGSGRHGVSAAVWRASDSSGYVRGTEWCPGMTEHDASDAGRSASSVNNIDSSSTRSAWKVDSGDLGQLPTMTQVAKEADMTTTASHPTGIHSSIPAIRRPDAVRLWRVSMDVDGCVTGFARPPASHSIAALLQGVLQDKLELGENDIAMLFTARGADFDAVCR